MDSKRSLATPVTSTEAPIAGAVLAPEKTKTASEAPGVS